MNVTSPWLRDDLVEAVRCAMTSPLVDDARYHLSRVEVDGDVLRVVFRWDREPGSLFGVQFDLRRLPVGPSTGEEADTPDQWAFEVWLSLDEEINTCALDQVERSLTPAGVVLLRWPGGRWSR